MRNVWLVAALGESWANVLPIADRRGKGQVGVSELLRCPVGECRMRPHTVVIVAPRSEYSAGLGKRREQRLVQALVAQPAVETLHERVLLRLTGLDIVPVDPHSLASGQDRHAGELGAVVGNAGHRLASDRNDGVELSRNANA
jgi:hypothetical protein